MSKWFSAQHIHHIHPYKQCVEINGQKEEYWTIEFTADLVSRHKYINNTTENGAVRES